MVDTTDSKSVASNRVRVQVSSPVDFYNPEYLGIFLFNSYFSEFSDLNSRSGTALALSHTMVEPNMARCRSPFFNGSAIVGKFKSLLR